MMLLPAASELILAIPGRVPNRFGTVRSEPKPRECQAPKIFINRIITTVNFPNTSEPEQNTNRNSALLRDQQRFFEECPRSQKHLHIGVPKQHVTDAARLQTRTAPGDEQTGFGEKPFQSCAGARHSKSCLRKLAFSCEIHALIVCHLSFHLLANIAVSESTINMLFVSKSLLGRWCHQWLSFENASWGQWKTHFAPKDDEGRRGKKKC